MVHNAEAERGLREPQRAEGVCICHVLARLKAMFGPRDAVNGLRIDSMVRHLLTEFPQGFKVAE